MGRAEKGIIITAGTFAADARKEASRDGATAIELVDGEKLVAMFVSLDLRPTGKPLVRSDISTCQGCEHNR